jgi:hypothetical protein
MVVNFRTRGISRDIHKLAQTSTLKKKKNTFWCLVTSKRSLILMGFGVQVLGFLLGFERFEEESAIRKAMGFGFGVVG